MTLDKHYTVSCRNKFAALDSDDSSENEEKNINEKNIKEKNTKEKNIKEKNIKDTHIKEIPRDKIKNYSTDLSVKSSSYYKKEDNNIDSREENEGSSEYNRRGRGRGGGYMNNYGGSYGGFSRRRNNIGELGREGNRGYNNRGGGYTQNEEKRNEEIDGEYDRTITYSGNRGRRNYRGGRQEFDRQSRRGYIVDSKKDGYGKHNWGNPLHENYECEDFNKEKKDDYYYQNKNKDYFNHKNHIDHDNNNKDNHHDNTHDNINNDNNNVDDNNNSVLLNGDNNNNNNNNNDDDDDKKKNDTEKKTQMITLDEYKKIQDAKRFNLQKNISSTEEKHEEGKDIDNASDTQRRKKNQRNVFDYYSKDGGNGLNMFSGSRRGRGGRRGFSYNNRADSSAATRYRFGKGRAAPDLEDERSFPKLC